MKNEKEIANAMLFSAVKNFTQLGDEQHAKQFRRNLAGYLFFAGAEAVSVVLRKNHHRKTLNLGALITACTVFAGVSFFSFFHLKTLGLSDAEQNKTFTRGMVYAVITILVIWQGYEKYRKANDFSIYPVGQSYLQAFFKKEVRNHVYIVYFYEPILLIGIGVCYCFYDVIGGVPIILSGLSAWILTIIVRANLGNRVQKQVNNDNSQNYNPESGFSS